MLVLELDRLIFIFEYLRQGKFYVPPSIDRSLISLIVGLVDYKSFEILAPIVITFNNDTVKSVQSRNLRSKIICPLYTGVLFREVHLHCLDSVKA